MFISIVDWIIDVIQLKSNTIEKDRRIGFCWLYLRRYAYSLSSVGRKRKIECLNGLLHDFFWTKCVFSTLVCIFTSLYLLSWLSHFFIFVVFACVFKHSNERVLNLHLNLIKTTHFSCTQNTSLTTKQYVHHSIWSWSFKYNEFNLTKCKY